MKFRPSPTAISLSAQIRTPPSIVQSQFGSFAWFIMSKTGTKDPQSPSLISNQSGKTFHELDNLYKTGQLKVLLTLL